MEYLSTKAIAIKWGISDRRVRILCAAGKINGAIKQGKLYLIQADATKPGDGRINRGKIIPTIYKELFDRINVLKKLLDSARPLTGGETLRLRDEFVVDFTYNSNAIEGNTLTLQETSMVLAGITIDKKPLKDHLEAIGHRDAFEYINTLINEKTILSERIIKEIHSLVLSHHPEDKGVYRRIPVRILGAANDPPQPYIVAKLMEQLIIDNKNKKTVHIIERIAWFHLIFESIHPFIDGNGRTGRLLINFDLMQNGYPPVNVKFTDRKRYYEAFNAFHINNDISRMVIMIGEYVEERLKQYLEIVEFTKNR